MRSIYSPDGFSTTFLNAQLTVGAPRVEYAPWTDSPSASIWRLPPTAPLFALTMCGMSALFADQDRM